MERAKLIEKLELVAPALSDNDTIPILTHVWFTGEELMACNDQIAISTPLETDFVGAVPGSTLTALLRASLAKEVDLEDKNTHLHIKAASARIKLPVMPEDAFVFEMPSMPKGCELKDKKLQALFDAFELCRMSIGSDKTVPDQLGITFMPVGNETFLFSTNFSTLTHVRLPFQVCEERVIVPEAFVVQFLKLASDAKKVSLHIASDHVLYSDEENNLFGRLIEDHSPRDFLKLMDDHLPEKARKDLVPVPAKLKLILDRASVICDSKTDRYVTRITVDDDEIIFESKSDRGEARDTLAAEKKQAKTSLSIEPKHLRRGIDIYDKYMLRPNCAVMAKDDAVFLVAALEGPRPSKKDIDQAAADANDGVPFEED